MKTRTIKGGVILALCIVFGNYVAAQETETSFVHVPSTISEQAQAIIRMLSDPSLLPEPPASDDIKAWKAIQEEREAFSLERQKPVVELLRPAVTEMKLGGVPVLDVKPINWKDNRKVMVYTHGGSTLFLVRNPRLAVQL